MILLWTAHNELYLAPSKTGTQPILPIKLHLKKTLMIFKSLSLMVAVIIWYIFNIYLIMVLLVQLIQQQYDIMLLSTSLTHWHHNRTAPPMGGYLKKVELTSEMNI